MHIAILRQVGGVYSVQQHEVSWTFGIQASNLTSLLDEPCTALVDLEVQVVPLSSEDSAQPFKGSSSR